ncbi:hypothetical protein KPH14_003194 [Odynerus spinipes]|uniref:RRM domain-containing protein n=1 Tax=Odynerus spinipes TaxID=1348599 RepID=A0AAD9VUI2_9HYME|nr:hypothetical protein KPH14_003194 [Odynerus spinipes]
MDDDARTLWCGNLSEKVTEDILYELFLQGGPVQRVSIPKDRDGKQRAYGFITYKHPRSPQIEKQRPESVYNLNHVLQLGQQTIIGNLMPNTDSDMLSMNVVPNTIIYTGKLNTHRDDRHSRRIHPYHRDHGRNKQDHHKDHRSYSSRNNNSRSSDYPKHNNHKNTKRHY